MGYCEHISPVTAVLGKKKDGHARKGKFCCSLTNVQHITMQAFS
jgi:hypothetical protein